jgi:AraC family transcriptional regulator
LSLSPRNQPARYSHSTTSVTITDVTCRTPRSGYGPERYASGTHVMFVRDGAFVLDGSAVGRRVTATAGTALFFNAGEAFRVSHPTSRGDVSTTLAFSPTTVRDIVRQYGPVGVDADACLYPLTHAVVNPQLLLQLHLLRLELRKEVSNLDSIRIDEISLSLVGAVVRSAFAGRSATSAHGGGGRRRREIAESVKEALVKNPFAPTSLGDLATYFDLSPFHLSRMFTAEVGVPIHRYLLGLRLAASLERLSESPARLAAIALDAGFSSPSHFSTAFRKAFGACPATIRRSAASS